MNMNANKAPRWAWKLLLATTLCIAGAGGLVDGYKFYKVEKVEKKNAAPAPMAKPAGMTKTVVVPANTPLVPTGLYVQKGQWAEFSQASPQLVYIRGEQYDVPVRMRHWQQQWLLPGEIQFRGGPEPTTITVKVISN